MVKVLGAHSHPIDYLARQGEEHTANFLFPSLPLLSWGLWGVGEGELYGMYFICYEQKETLIKILS